MDSLGAWGRTCRNIELPRIDGRPWEDARGMVVGKRRYKKMEVDGKMKGLVVTSDKKIELVSDIPMPEIGAYEALVKMECCMICNGTDMEIIRGELPEAPNFPLMLGHESAGRVVAVGDKVTTYKIGDRVIRASLLDNEKYYSAWGGFAEYGVVIDTRAMRRDGLENKSGLTQQVVSERITPEQASLMITLKETCSAIKRIGIRNEEVVLIVGDGPVGLCFLSNLKLLGIENVAMLGNRKGSLEVAERLGAIDVFWNKDAMEKARLKETYGGRVTIYLDTIGSTDTIGQGMDFVAADGKIVVYGLGTGSNLQLDLKDMRNFSLQFVQWPIEECEMLTHDVISEGILSGKIKTDELITHRLPIEEYEAGFAAIQEKRALKVALMFE